LAVDLVFIAQFFLKKSGFYAGHRDAARRAALQGPPGLRVAGRSV
jgi:hypothetical protein